MDGGGARRGGRAAGERRRGCRRPPRSRSSSATAAPRGYLPEHTLRGLRAGDQARRRLHRAGPGGDQGRPPDRPPRAEHHDHDRRRRPPASSPAASAPRWSTASPRRAGSPPTSRSRRSGRCAPSSRSPSARSSSTAASGSRRSSEVIALAKRYSKRSGTARSASIPETKHPTYHQQLGLPLERRLVKTLDRAGLEPAAARRSSSRASSRRTSSSSTGMTPVRLVQLIDANDVNPDGSLDYTAAVRPAL